jgi:hypothetical protein
MVALRSDRVDAVNDVQLMNEGGDLMGLEMTRGEGEGLTLWLRCWLCELVSDESASAEEDSDETTDKDGGDHWWSSLVMVMNISGV